MEPSESLVTGYRRDGYAVISGLFPEAWVREVASDVNQLYVVQLRRLGLPVADGQDDACYIANMRRLFDSDIPLYLAVTRHASKLISLQKLMVSDRIMELLRSFNFVAPTLPEMPVLHVASDTMRIPGGYFGVAAHQDWPSIQGGLDTITLWLPLMDVGDSQFPIEVIPRSHVRGLWEGTVTATATEIDRTQFVDDDFVRIAVRRGDGILFTGFTVHRTALQGCHGFRIASSTRYENAAEATFARRGYPCAYRRSVQRELITPGFPSASDVSDALDALGQ